MRRFATAQLAPMPWKNGGGVTREVACVPAGAGLDDFDWRVSIAEIAAGGPFSAFPGVDRVITLLRGAGVRLASRDGAIDHRLATPFEPFAFPGEAAIGCELLGGACHDLNVMTRRGRCRASVAVLRSSGELPASHGGVLLAIDGSWQAGGESLAAGAGLVWDEPQAGWQLQTGHDNAALAAILIQR